MMNDWNSWDKLVAALQVSKREANVFSVFILLNGLLVDRSLTMYLKLNHYRLYVVFFSMDYDFEAFADSK